MLRPLSRIALEFDVFARADTRELLADDGVRENPDWDECVRIDGMVKLMLEMFAVPYIPIASLAMQERVRLLERVLGMAGLQAVSAAPPETAREAQPVADDNGGPRV